MMQKLEKLIDSLTLLADMAAVALQHMNNPMQTIAGDQSAVAATAAPKAPKSHKAKVPAAAVPPVAAAAPAPAPTAPAEEEKIEDQLGLGAAPEEQKAPAPKKELNDKDLQARVEEVTKQYTALCKNDTPAEGGKNPGLVRAIALLQGTFKAKSLPVMTREQKVEWIATMEKWISEHK